jgi:adenosylcobinamide kinase/adenosylcobinamide-phosphate guanylyltransferase
MADLTLITGGCRSGKSDYALRLAESLSTSRAMLATAPVTDAEMRRRIERHQQERRGRGWETIEEQTDLARVLRAAPHEVILIDCVTLWVNNLMYEAGKAGVEIDEGDVAARCGEVIAAIEDRRGTVIAVSNEVGLGVVPENAAARRFRDLAGRANQLLAAQAAAVTLLCCGIPMQIKPQPHSVSDL